jgi:hypothetical protein
MHTKDVAFIQIFTDCQKQAPLGFRCFIALLTVPIGIQNNPPLLSVMFLLDWTCEATVF